MELAKLTSKGQITVPIEIRKKLNLKTGDKIVFVEDGNAIRMVNSSILALEKVQKAMEGKAGEAGIKDEDDVVALCKEVRKELYAKNYANHD